MAMVSYLFYRSHTFFHSILYTHFHCQMNCSASHPSSKVIERTHFIFLIFSVSIPCLTQRYTLLLNTVICVIIFDHFFQNSHGELLFYLFLLKINSSSCNSSHHSFPSLYSSNPPVTSLLFHIHSQFVLSSQKKNRLPRDKSQTRHKKTVRQKSSY